MRFKRKVRLLLFGISVTLFNAAFAYGFGVWRIVILFMGVSAADLMFALED